MEGSPIRVLVTAFAPVPGSSPHAQAVLAMAAALTGEMDAVTLKTESLGHLDMLGGARLLRVPVGVGTPSEQRDAFGRACVRQLESGTYDVVHVRGPREGRLLVERKKSYGFRLVYEVATFPNEAEGNDTEKEWLAAHETCAEAADLILVPSEAAARHLGERGHAGKVAVVHPGVDVDAYDWWPTGVGEAARLLYLGTFAADRDLSSVLAAIKQLVKERPLDVLIAGEPDGESRERLRRIVKSFGLDDTVTVRGEPRALMLPMLIGAADLCLAPASAAPRFVDFGDIPQPLLEYLACRRPVVAAGVPGVAEVLRDDKEGLLYPPGDIDTLADSIRTILDQDTLRERLIESGYDRVRWRFSGGARRRRIAEVYEMMMPGSQSYDAWAEGFDRDLTGSVEVPPDFAMLEEPETNIEPAATDTLAPDGPDEQVLFVSEVARQSGYEPVPGRPDTNPGVEALSESDLEEIEDDLESVPTQIAASKTEQIPRTDTEQIKPPPAQEPDTGPIRNPDG